MGWWWKGGWLGLVEGRTGPRLRQGALDAFFDCILVVESEAR